METSAPGSLRPQDRSGGLARLIRRVDPRVIDVLIALVLTAAALGILIGRSDDGDSGNFRSDDTLGIALVLLQTLPLAVRRVAPVGVFLVINAALVAHSALGYEIVAAGTFGSLIAVYGAASLTDNRRRVFVAAVSAAAIVAFFATNRQDFPLPDVATTAGTWAIAWLAGTFVRLRGEQVEVAGARAARLEAERDMLAREAVADERARMARELHDIVGHALNLIVIQASGAGRVFDSKPEATREALASIESTGREALGDMERLLGVLRTAESEDGTSGPQPGLAQLDGLAAHISEAGIPVEIVVEGSEMEIPASVELSAYRIVQESLTNCLKHSGASHATVTLRYGPADLEVEVTDNGRGSPQHTEDASRRGRGHLGMRERVALFGGEISVGPVSATGGYRVRARLPFKSTPA
jgi:signal transduction histidine kinase